MAKANKGAQAQQQAATAPQANAEGLGQDAQQSAPQEGQDKAAAPADAALQIKVKRLTESARMPAYGSDGAACFDLFADLGKLTDVTIEAGGSFDLATGIACEIPDGHCLLVFSRSGHGFKHGVSLVNSVGVIDSDYTGEIRVKLKNEGRRGFMVTADTRVAQAMVMPVTRMELVEAEGDLKQTERGDAGFGSTGG